ncbi:MAG: hypothetical protein CYPHOPRED_003124 [Cyphobasidiales sp. Tagirdzhanova-0007]|nr:MAG: hypothetical protein CYPHOPRED_003124 [Cyphobasidiales sp. Tagirdzhanova-0007]
MSMPRHRLTLPVAGIVVITAGIVIYGQKSLFGGEGQPSKGNSPTPRSMKASPPENPPKDTNHSSIVSQGTAGTEKSGKEAFQDAVKGTRAEGPGGQADNRTPSKERVARGGN